jgi:hypothetical protein
MKRATTTQALAWVVLVGAATVPVQGEEAPPLTPPGMPGVDAQPQAPGLPDAAVAGGNAPLSYMDAVRAQRHTLNERGDATPETLEPPPGDYGTWSEDLEQERQSHRETIRERIARQQEVIRAHRRLVNPWGEYLRDRQQLRRDSLQAQAQADWEQRDQLQPPGNSLWNPLPYSWDNPWYYHGY